MKRMTNSDSERFRSGADKYAAYLDTPAGRLRLDLAFSNLREFLPQTARSLRALDLGCGPGTLALRLARLAIEVTLLDSSRPMLDLARRAAQEAGVTDRIKLKLADVEQLLDLFPAASFDVVLCHNVLEYVEDPYALLSSAARTLRDRSSIISVLMRNPAGEVLKAALQAGDLATAEHNLTAEWGEENLYGGKVRLLDAESMHQMLRAASLTILAERGVRVVSDYLPAKVCRTADYDRIFDLERKLGQRPEFAAIARYTQFIARRN
jgi:S-adenosylmethionine-dependent methyltransferase